MAKVAVLGYGTVGSGIVEVINTNSELINKRVGDKVEVKYILDLREFPGDPYENLVVHDVNEILLDDEVTIICEAMGGIEPAYTFTKNALLKGKSVCTSNKALVAQHGTELIEIARKNNCNYMFEASCGGGIPIIRPLRTSLSPEKIVGIKGILNGTTNYILSKMEHEGAAFEDVLKDAQAKGYAEANPEADVEGHDACRKIAILSSLAFGKTVFFEDVHTEGITKLTSDDFAYMKQINATIKLLGMSKEQDGKYYAMVAPFVLFDENPLYSVDGVMNAVLVTGNTVGDTMYYGAGAGKLPTASAVVSDVMDCAKHTGIHLPCNWETDRLSLSAFDQTERRFFVRVTGSEQSAVKNVFADVTFLESTKSNELGFVTEALVEKDFMEKVKALNPISIIRVEA